MYVPTITTRATNVELTDGRRALIIKRLQPLGSALSPGTLAHLDVVIRRLPGRIGHGRYCVSAKLTTGEKTFVAMEIDSNLSKTLRKAERTLRRLVSGGVPKYGALRNKQADHLMRYLKYSF